LNPSQYVLGSDSNTAKVGGEGASVSTFTVWNDRLRDYFFCEANAGNHVRLAVNRNLLDDEFEDLGGSEDFEHAVYRGPDWPTGFDEELRDFYHQSGLEERAIGMHHAWDGLDRRPPGYDYLGAWGTWRRVPPPYLPYLCLFSYAWTLDESWTRAFLTELDAPFVGGVGAVGE
jgi:hypothetical protein